MIYRLSIESIDDEPEKIDFPTKDEAIEFARQWFVEGYEEHIKREPSYWPDRVKEEESHLLAALRDGRTFYCKMFYERVELHEIAGDA